MRTVDPAEVGARVAEFEAAYLAVYQLAPYEETAADAARFAAGLPEDSHRDGFTMVVAEATDGDLIGFAYGYTFAADRWWRNATSESELTRGQPKFAVLEFVVLSRWRGARIGTALMARLLTDRPEPFASLCANPRALARQMYRHWGWQQVGTTNPPRIGPMDVLIKDLRAAA